MERYEIAVIGTGPAGLSAAITAKIRNKKILLIGSRDLSTKVQKAHTVQNYLGLPAVSGDEMQKAFQSHLDSMGIEITEGKVNAVYAIGNYFSIQSGDQIYEADSVILATGIVMGKPYPGETELLGKGVSYCATCDAPLYKKKKVAVIASDPQEESEAEFLAELASEVLYFPLYKEELHVSEKVKVIRETPEAIVGTVKVQQLQTKEHTYDVDGVFILRKSIAPNQLVPGVAVEDNQVLVNHLMETSIPGCFACGDIVGKPYQYIKSAGEGNVAALSAVDYLDQKKRGKVNA
jgi:thioredoxin reductase (NADPH)